MEKVARLLGLLDAIATVPLLARHLILKGGTALNLFLLDVPRLSVDIDVNLIGAPSREEMMALRPSVEHALQAAFASEQLDVRRRPDAHAGGKWSLRYRSVFGQGAVLELDLNTLHRVPLWEPQPLPSRLPVFSLRPTLLQDVHEIVAGKLAALVSRGAGRDIFDAHELLSTLPLQPDRLRLAFVVAAGQASADWSEYTPDHIQADPRELRARLLPLLRRTHVPGVRNIDAWIEQLVEQTQRLMEIVLPLSADERSFVTEINERGRIDPELLTSDAGLAASITLNPGLRWKALNVRRHRGLSD
ncbi:MAG: nucleotidyl transferase AbiEii/AbiGii toxin family protein [Planctomycetota bacterium]|nr:MAG: nucleotidyl transferase AbiEii/AbiGii toxin family protein [Planctomycetota bacterium]